jgi:uncharacterized damage-inducible protein DinB
MKKQLLYYFLTASFFCSVFNSHAQQLSTDSIKSFAVNEWSRAKRYTDAYLNTMPADKYGFKATDSVRSFAQQMLHLASANVFLISTATGAEAPSWSAFDEHSPTAAGKDSVSFYVDHSYDFCISAINGLPADKWGEMIKTFGRSMSRFALIMKGFEHQTHHRGQSTIYIRLAGIKPPNEMLF